MLPSQIIFYKRFAELRVQNIINVCIGHQDYHAFIISQNREDISAEYPYMSLMTMDLETAKVVAYGEDMDELGLNLINHFKGLDMQLGAIYQSMNEFIDVLTRL